MWNVECLSRTHHQSIPVRLSIAWVQWWTVYSGDTFQRCLILEVPTMSECKLLWNKAGISDSRHLLIKRDYPEYLKHEVTGTCNSRVVVFTSLLGIQCRFFFLWIGIILNLKWLEMMPVHKNESRHYLRSTFCTTVNDYYFTVGEYTGHLEFTSCFTANYLTISRKPRVEILSIRWVWSARHNVLLWSVITRPIADPALTAKRFFSRTPSSNKAFFIYSAATPHLCLG